jgi:enhancing lycopene biosynthesis protein 2
MAKRVALILSGCGSRDGAEIHESVLTALALRLEGFDPKFFSLDLPQAAVVNHITDETQKSSRNMLEESARIARGEIDDVKNLDPREFEALALPGGFGVARNLCTFAEEGASAQVNPLIEEKITAFLKSKKPIMAVCIAPALVGLVAKKQGLSITLTLGPANNGATQAMKSLGHRVEAVSPSSFVADPTHKIVTTPAFMHDTTVDQLWPGIQGAARELAGWILP